MKTNLESYNNEISDINEGMPCKAKIITGKKKWYITY